MQEIVSGRHPSLLIITTLLGVSLLVMFGFLWGRSTAPVETLSAAGPTATIPAPIPRTATPLPQLANHCAQTGDTYWLAVSRAKTLLEVADLPIDKQTTSPSGEFTVYQAARNVFVAQAGTGEVLKIATGAIYDITSRLYWSQTRLAFVITKESGQQSRDTLYIYDFSHGLAGYESVILMGRYFSLGGWSPDGEYLMLSHDTETASNQFALWSFSRRRLVFETGVEISRSSWSPDSRWLALVTPSDQSSKLTLVQAETGTTRTFSLETTQYATALFLFWSPNSRYVLLIRNDAETKIYGIEGGEWRLGDGDLHLPDMSSYSLSWTLPFFWLPGGEGLAFWKHPPCCPYQLVRWTPGDPLTTVLETSVPPLLPRGRYLTDPLAYQESQGFLALEHGSRPVIQDRVAIYTETQQVELMRPDGTGAEVLIPDTRAVLKLVWASDGRAIGGVWTVQEAAGRHVYLSWSGPEGISTLELESDISTVHYLEWAPQDVALALIVERPSGETVIKVDPVTGTRATLLDEMEDVYAPTFYDQDGFFTLLWQSKTGQSGYDGYRQDGAREFRVIFPFRPYDRIFFSPDRQWAAPKGWKTNGEGGYLALVRTDGSEPQVLLSGLNGIGHPLWSPDSRMVAFTTWTVNTRVTLNILSIDGEMLWQTPYPNPEAAALLTWQECP